MKPYTLMVVAVPEQDAHKCKFPPNAYRISTEFTLLDDESWLLAALERMNNAKLAFEYGNVNLGTVH